MIATSENKPRLQAQVRFISLFSIASPTKLTPFPPSSALTHFNATTLSNTVTAFHDILPNDEITISCTSSCP